MANDLMQMHDNVDADRWSKRDHHTNNEWAIAL